MGRFAMLLYGVVCYAIGMGALVYLILFTVALPVLPLPVTVDSGAASSWMVALLVNAGLAALFGLQHGIMARHKFKEAWTKIIPEAAERSTFVAATGVAVAVLVIFWQSADGSIWSVENETARIVLYAVALGGFGFTAASSFIIDHFDLFGLRQPSVKPAELNGLIPQLDIELVPLPLGDLAFGDVIAHTGFTDSTYNGRFVVSAVPSTTVYEVATITSRICGICSIIQWIIQRRIVGTISNIS